jgi:hypothetical protein
MLTAELQQSKVMAYILEAVEWSNSIRFIFYMSSYDLASDLIEIDDRIWYLIKGKSKTGIMVLHDCWGIRSHIIAGIESLRLGEHTIMMPDLFAF